MVGFERNGDLSFVDDTSTERRYTFHTAMNQ
jgi:hypothetical protein